MAKRKTKQEATVVNNYLQGNITVNANDNMEQQETLLNVSKALLNITEYFKTNNSKNICAVRIDTNGKIN